MGQEERRLEKTRKRILYLPLASCPALSPQSGNRHRTHVNGVDREFLPDSHSWLPAAFWLLCATFLNRDGKSNRTAKPR
ncbi:MAG: hypothetical protein ABSE07_01330 [Methanoregula sp.]|jgi:hypothetical protein